MASQLFASCDFRAQLLDLSADNDDSQSARGSGLLYELQGNGVSGGSGRSLSLAKRSAPNLAALSVGHSSDQAPNVRRTD